MRQSVKLWLNFCGRRRAGDGTQTGATLAVRMPPLVSLYSAPLAQSGYLDRVVAELLQYRVGVPALIGRRTQFAGLRIGIQMDRLADDVPRSETSAS